MSKKFTPCPACGAVGEIGSNCLFCGTAINLNETHVASDTRVVPCRNVSPRQYAENISIYRRVKQSKSAKLMHVSIGDENGIINLNGEIVYPLQHEYELLVISDTILLLRDERQENGIITEDGHYIHLNKLLNLETMEMYDGIDSSDIPELYVWESFRCKGRIDPITWNIISPPSGYRISLAMPCEKYKEWKKIKEEEEEEEEEENQAFIKEEKRRTKITKIKLIIAGIFVVISVILYNILDHIYSESLGELLFTLFWVSIFGALASFISLSFD